jgi:hypothetical protein
LSPEIDLAAGFIIGTKIAAAEGVASLFLRIFMLSQGFQLQGVAALTKRRHGERATRKKPIAWKRQSRSNFLRF